MSIDDSTKRYLISAAGIIFIAGGGWFKLNSMDDSIHSMRAEFAESVKGIQTNVSDIAKEQTSETIDIKLLQARVLQIEQQQQQQKPTTPNHR